MPDRILRHRPMPPIYLDIMGRRLQPDDGSQLFSNTLRQGLIVLFQNRFPPHSAEVTPYGHFLRGRTMGPFMRRPGGSDQITPFDARNHKAESLQSIADRLSRINERDRRG